MRRLLLCVGLLWSVVVTAAEVDSFTHRNPDLQDITEEVNHYVNSVLRYGVSRTHSCRETELYASVSRVLVKEFMGGFERHLWFHPQIAQAHTRLDESIYRDFPFDEAWVLRIVPFAMTPLLKVNGQYVGADKFGHFFTEGYRYFLRHYRRGHTLEETLRWGWSLEAGFFGAANTGIHSHGDLAANFKGMHFWRGLVHPNELTGEPPLVECRAGRFKLVRAFDARDYVDVSFDEALNCNQYSSATLERLVEARIAEMGARGGERASCPIRPEACAEMRAVFKENAHWIVTPQCL